ncbi:MAG: C10 family peptidase [Deltaproteobacteria bacterium]|nr:C10 family peptidase [Deltaproteobacteria bacterium]
MDRKPSIIKSFVLVLSFLAIVLISHNEGYAAPVSLEQAGQVARNWAKFKAARTSATGISEVPAVAAGQQVYYAGRPVAFNFELSPQGHVLVPIDDQLSPVILYSTTSKFSVGDRGPAGWILSELAAIYRQLGQQPVGTRAASAAAVNPVISQAWQQLTTSGTAADLLPGMARAVTKGPLLTTTWDQGAPYNNYCPLINGQSTWAGCVALAWSQVLRYWNWPSMGTGSHSYSSNGQIFSANFNHAYYWERMPTSLNSGSTPDQIDAVARLISDMGVACDSDYGLSSTGSELYANEVLGKYFHYKNSMQLIDRQDVTYQTWLTYIENEIDAGRPVVFSIFTSTDGHETVIDGYQTGTLDMVHINYGWSGSYNGYYNINSPFQAGGYNWQVNSQEIVIGIQPDYSGGFPGSDGVWQTSEGSKLYFQTYSTGSAIAILSADGKAIIPCYDGTFASSTFDGTDLISGAVARFVINFSSPAAANLTYTDLKAGTSRSMSLTKATADTASPAAKTDGIWAVPGSTGRFYVQSYSSGGMMILSSTTGSTCEAFYDAAATQTLFNGLDVYQPHVATLTFNFPSAQSGSATRTDLNTRAVSNWTSGRFATVMVPVADSPTTTLAHDAGMMPGGTGSSSVRGWRW